MNTEATWQTESSSSDATFELGVALGHNCRGGEVFLLTSDLGGGKTTFTKGLAKGAGSKDVVTSPTFTVSQIYKGSDLTLWHFDFYRLTEAGVVAEELAEALEDPKNIVVVEWGDVVEGVLPVGRVTIKFENVADDENRRKITVTCPKELSYLMEGIKQ